MHDTVERIQNLILKHNISVNKLSQEIGLNKTFFSDWKSGKAKPSAEALSKLADYFGVSVDYLLGRDEAPTQSIFDAFPSIRPVTKRRIPMLGEIACGTPIYANEDRESYVELGTDLDVDFCLTAKGDSMIGARIHSGDIIFCKSQNMVNNGEIAAVIIGDEVTLKRVFYYPEKQKLVLQAENPKYEPFVYVGPELNEIRILGKAVAFQSDIE